MYSQLAIRLALVGTNPRGLKKAFVLIGKTKGTQEMKLKNWLERLASSKKGNKDKDYLQRWAVLNSYDLKVINQGLLNV